MQFKLKAPGKINLHLKVLGRRDDGMHELVTLMQPLSVGDDLVINDEASSFSFTCTDPALARGNLVEKAALAWGRAAGLKPKVHLHLIKNLPAAAGLGGGSSDAAAALMGLNRLYGNPLSLAELAETAAGLGADVPFFLYGTSALCTGIGEMVEPWPDYPCRDYVLVNPGFEVSTAWVYRQLDLTWTKPDNLNRLYSMPIASEPLTAVMTNDLEKVTAQAYPELAGVKQKLCECGAEKTLMSGSGPTVFGVFKDAYMARMAAGRLGTGHGWWVLACRGIHWGEGQHGGDRSQGLRS